MQVIINLELFKIDYPIRSTENRNFINEVETGYTVKVPLFIEEGETIVISTSDGKYVSRA